MQWTTIILSTALSASAMPFILEFAAKNELYDSLGKRKIHSGQVPRLGGVGMFWAFFVAAIAYPLIAEAELYRKFSGRFARLAPFIIGAALVHAIGLIDDVKGVKARTKLLFQMSAALVVVAGGGYRFQGFSYAPDALAGSLGWLSAIISFLWIVGVTNAINLIDGLDGLAGGLSFIASIAYAAFYYLAGDAAASFLCIMLAGAIAGFLIVNFPAPRAKMFMGDSGSLFLGFSLSVIPFIGQSGGATMKTIGLLPAFVLLAIPVIDTLCAIVRRVAARVSIATPDRLHIHHRFFDSGYRLINILGIFYAAAACLAIVFIVASRLPAYLSFPVEIISLMILGLLFRFAISLHPKET